MQRTGISHDQRSQCVMLCEKWDCEEEEEEVERDHQVTAGMTVFEEKWIRMNECLSLPLEKRVAGALMFYFYKKPKIGGCTPP